MTDSPNGNYPDNNTNVVFFNQSINLTSATSASLNFWTKWDIEAGYDYAEVSASNDGGGSWIPLCGKYTKAGNANQDQGNPIYDGTQPNWLWEEMSLNSYLGQTITIRYQLVSDQSVNYDGFYFDDLSISTISTSTGINEKPTDLNALSQNIPNPATSFTYVNLSLKDKKNVVFNVYNSFGQLIKQEKIINGQSSLSIDTRPFASGTYFYQVYNDNYHSKMMKMIIMK